MSEEEQADISALQAELAEQCRLLAMGSEREARLMAKVAELERATSEPVAYHFIWRSGRNELHLTADCLELLQDIYSGRVFATAHPLIYANAARGTE